MERYRPSDDPERSRRGVRRRTEGPKPANQNGKPLDVGKASVDALNRSVVVDKKSTEEDIDKAGE